MIQVAENLTVDDREVHERFVRSGGSAGQNPRKEATAVEVRFDIGASSLPQDVKDRLVLLAGKAVSMNGVLKIVSRAHRSQAENRETARARLVTMLQQAGATPETRRPTRPRKAVREQRLVAKRVHSGLKQSRHPRPLVEE